MKILISFLFILQFFVSFSKSSPVHVYLIVDNFQMTKSDFQSWSNTIFLESKLPITELKIYSHSLKESLFPDTWSNSKKSKSTFFYPSKIDCDYSPCSILKSFIKDYSTAKTKLFIGEGEFNCNLRELGVENGYFKNNSEDIKLKIEDEIAANKSSGKELSLIFYIPSSSIIEKPLISFKYDTLKIKKGESVILSPTLSENSKIKWDANESLSCLDCDQPEATPSSTTTYIVRSKNTSGCEAEPKKITVEVNLSSNKKCEDNNNAFFQSKSWDTQDLKVTKFRNGEDLLFAQSDEEWERASEEGLGAYYFCEGDISKGVLYNWYAVNDSRGLAPYEWRVPTKGDFDSLISANKEINSREEKSGFILDLKYNGYRTGDGFVSSIGQASYIWTSTKVQNDYMHSYSCMVLKADQNPMLIKASKDEGYCVRCIKNCDEEIPAFVDEEATFSGCAAFVSQHCKYPERALDEGLEGRCYVKFIVDKRGNISNITVLKGVPGCPECDEEAKRVFAMMPKWTPATLNGITTISKHIEFIRFQIY